MSDEKIGPPCSLVCRADDRAAWLEARRAGLGGSDIAAVVGASPWKSALELYCEKVGITEPDDLSSNERVEWGVHLEPVIIEVFGKRTGRQVLRSGELLQSRAHPWALATLDAMTAEKAGEPPWPLEIKTTGNGDEWINGAPEHYMAQVQHQLLVTGMPRATIACLIAGQRMVWQDIERDETWIRKIVILGAAFWERVQRKNPPTADGSESARRALGKIYPQDDGSVIALPPEMMDDADTLAYLKANRKESDASITGIENRIKAALGTATRGVLPNGYSFSWTTQERAAYEVKASTTRVLRVHAPKKEKTR
jgi:putative phage-type endonuclease